MNKKSTINTLATTEELHESLHYLPFASGAGDYRILTATRSQFGKFNVNAIITVQAGDDGDGSLYSCDVQAYRENEVMPRTVASFIGSNPRKVYEDANKTIRRIRRNELNKLIALKMHERMNASV